jgi:CheY-like chemotaxis protein
MDKKMKIMTQLLGRIFSLKQEDNIKANENLPKNSILLAEDNPVIVFPIKNLLERQGYHVTAVEDGNKALSYLKSYTYHWGLLDLMLPEMDAFDLVKNYRLWEKQANKPYLPLFGLTGYPFEEMELTCKDAGMALVFGKPFRLDALKRIENFLKNPESVQSSSLRTPKARGNLRRSQ